MKKVYLTFIVVLLSPFACLAQYTIYKLENKIGIERALIGNNGNQLINIMANDRGAATSLAASFLHVGKQIKYTSTGNTSRFTTEHIDTAFVADGSFPLGINGSIKMHELFIGEWVTAGMPAFITSALTKNKVTVGVLGKMPDAVNGGSLTALAINNGLDEILWINEKNEAVFLSGCDAESDKREVIDDRYAARFKLLSQKSDDYLIQRYLEENKGLGQHFDIIAITGANIIDLDDAGKIKPNSMLLLKDGKIAYVGALNKEMIPTRAHIIDAAGKFLLPGLWNMHAHLFHPEYLKRELLSGVTTVRDMGNEFDLITKLKSIADSTGVPAPHILAAGLLDGDSPNALGATRGSNEAGIKANIKKYHDAGFNQIKIYSYIKKGDFNTIVKEARSYNMDVVGHLPNGYTIGYFIDNGMNSISHIHYFMNNMKFTGGDLTSANKPLIDKLLEKKIYLDPTLNVYALTGDKKVDYYRRFVKLFFDSGVPIVAGTDNEGTVAQEVQNYVKAGLSLLDAIRAATIVPATMMKMNNESGSIEQGKKADILLLNKNPLEDITALNDIDTVIKGQLIFKK
ncbi:amidohydrolase family protein [Mucilaginibacter sp. CAU 1740]|uniref:amidohydrolase family protein n=1 Tax=Mucilaginibacter sp. CAU 1740 TaxID=3140365 RepID=UPI00325AADF3